MEIATAYYQSPIGIIKIHGDEQHLHYACFVDEVGENTRESTVVNLCIQQFDEYFKGLRQDFDLPLLQTGTDFQQSVWKHLTKIPYGETISYLQLSEQMKNPLAIRAIGAANGKNKIVIIVPCHRVIGNDGSLTGFAAGLWRKQWLLNHEKNVSGKGQQTLF